MDVRNVSDHGGRCNGDLSLISSGPVYVAVAARRVYLHTSSHRLILPSQPIERFYSWQQGDV